MHPDQRDLGFAPTDGCKIKQTVDKGITLGKINLTTDWDKMLVQSMFLRCI
jgi:hypothetical protein